MEKMCSDEKHIESRSYETARPSIKSSTLVVLGFIQVLIGGVIIVMGVVAINMQCHFSHIGIPFYGGVLAVITGFFGILSACKKDNSMVVTATVFSYLSATFCATALVIVMAIALDEEDNYWNFGRERCYDRHTDEYNSTCQQQFQHMAQKRQTTDTFILMTAVCEAIIAFANGVLLSINLCCRGSKGCSIKINCLQATDVKSCWADFWKAALPCCKPAQVYIKLSQADGSFTQIPVATFPVDQDNAFVTMVPTNMGGVIKTQDVSKISQTSEIPGEDIDIDASESSPLLD